MENLPRLLKRLGIKPKNLALYKRAFRHVSIPHDQAESYENLEFLGDAVLGLVVAEYLVKKFPEADVGHLTKFRSSVVNKVSLSRIARELGFEDHIEIEKSKLREASGVEDSVLADSFESVAGAILLDRGMRAAKKFILDGLKPLLKETIETGELMDYKSRLQERLQQLHKSIPRYRRIKAVGPDHARVFTVQCLFEGDILATGKGTSLKRAEQDAARKVLDTLGEEETPEIA